MPAKLDLTNQRFTRLVALYEAGNDHGQVLWLCRCDCKNTLIVSTVRLRSGNVKSCGCLKREQAIAKQKKATAAVIRDGTSKNICSKVVHSNTGVKGVSYNKWSKKYEAKLMLQGDVKFRHAYATLEEAVAARKKAEEKWFIPVIENWKQ